MRISDWSSDVCSSDLEDGRVSPLPMLFRAAADAEARAVAQRLLRDRVFEPLERWIGGGDAAVRAARFMMVSLGFFTYREHLPIAGFAGAIDPGLRRWLDAEFQAIVHGLHISSRRAPPNRKTLL